MEMPWLDVYAVHEWTVHEVRIPSAVYDALMAALEEKEIIASFQGESERAAEWWRDQQSLDGLGMFSDVEQLLGMGLDKVHYLFHEGVLAKEWSGHPAGLLVLAALTDSTNASQGLLGLTVGVAEP